MTNHHHPSPQVKATRALVIGGGIAGLIAARVLSDYYDQVQIVERDLLLEQPNLRAGTPQAFHIHRVVGRGQSCLDRLFPNFTSELIERGAVSTKNKKVQVVNFAGHFIVPAEEEASVSRALREWTIRQRVQAISNVSFSTGLDVVGLNRDAEHTRITGVHVRQRGQMEQPSLLEADLVIDASGYSTKLTQWLQALGYDVPEPERLTSDIGYSSRYYKVSPQFAQEWAGIRIAGQPSLGIRTANGHILSDNTWGIIFFGAAGHYPSTDPDKFDQQLRQITGPQLADMLQTEAEPITPIRGFRVAECILQNFDQMANWPAGLLVIGDAFCRLDPIYAHGISVAALQAEMLATHLKEQQRNPQRDFELRVLKSMREAAQPAWWLDAIIDLSWAGVTYSGQEPPKAVTLLQRYLELYIQEATKNMIGYLKQESSDENTPPPPPDPFSIQPSILSYVLVIDLVLSPNVIFNAITYRLLLDVEAKQEGPHLLQNITEQYKSSLEKILNEVIPHFSLPFMSQPADAVAD
ncbi:MAG TPA: FAD-dependent monooxygenase [Ktedonobacteraceae bacterium]|jgi:2-polyprenyl-6-methoxyphenol hydroxylase-like FAD-dependent oxidoreductase